ncbi:MAG: FHA domain-containing protein, partial [Geminicoccaceae bacterium]|nr:FHA domain-containing protein [Geminicoccaceae bacterium]
MAKVLVIEHETTGERRRLAGGRLVIGRGQSCDWVLAETGTASLSRRHCLLEGEGGTFTLRDLGSTNGTRRNGVPVPPEAAVPLADGDLLELGRQRLRVALEEAGGGRPPPVPSLDAVLAELAGGPGRAGPRHRSRSSGGDARGGSARRFRRGAGTDAAAAAAAAR